MRWRQRMRQRRGDRPPTRLGLTVLFALIVFFVLLVTMVIVGGVTVLLAQTGALERFDTPNLLFPIILFAIVSIVIGTLVGALMSRAPLRPVNKLIDGMNRLASGDFTVRLKMENHPVGREITTSFNLLAEELGKTEMLRSDFINNFSHEFKTPIVSIRGFGKLLRKGSVPPEQQAEYLDIIVEEAGRLADMATNVLNLTKVENQSILSDVTRLNLSEQIRGCVLLLEKKWTRKDLTIVADFDEVMVDASEEQLKQVWINLLDNAVKFSQEGGEIGILITQTAEGTIVSITNHGPEIKQEDMDRIFHKFWQGDVSHAAEGNGIGLSIARQIVMLHGGKISVTSTPEETAFTVSLPAPKI